MSYPLSFYLAAIALLGLAAELWRHRRASWALPALLTYLTVGAWYFTDLVLYGEKYRELPEFILSRSYLQVISFLALFRALLPWGVRRLATRQDVPPPRAPIQSEGLFLCAAVLWAGLFVIAISQMEWDVLGALFPLDARGGNQMWARASAGDAGATGFLISTGGYLYMVACSFFGILAVLQKAPHLKLAAVGMMALTWPFFLMGGTRNIFLAVCLPCVFTYALFGLQPRVVRLVVLLVAFLCLEVAFKVVISHRSTGFRDLLAGTETQEEVAEANDVEHQGLNMIQELAFINIYAYVDRLDPTMGREYFSQLVSVIPRAIWKGKPMFAIEYAKWRGFEDTTGNSDTGVVATISTGLIGQGVLEFGPLFGPIAPAVLMALWCGLLARWWTQRASVLRLCLFLLGIGITFNLGRNITMIILWPIAFAYLLVIAAEKFFQPKTPRSVTSPLQARPAAAVLRP